MPEKPIEELAAVEKMAPDDLGPELDSLARKGLVYRSADGSCHGYRLNDSFFGFLRSSFWPGWAADVSKLMAPLVSRYFLGGFFDPYAQSSRKRLRSLPVSGAIPEHPDTRPYEHAAQILDA